MRLRSTCDATPCQCVRWASVAVCAQAHPAFVPESTSTSSSMSSCAARRTTCAVERLPGVADDTLAVVILRYLRRVVWRRGLLWDVLHRETPDPTETGRSRTNIVAQVELSSAACNTRKRRCRSGCSELENLPTTQTIREQSRTHGLGPFAGLVVCSRAETMVARNHWNDAC